MISALIRAGAFEPVSCPGSTGCLRSFEGPEELVAHLRDWHSWPTPQIAAWFEKRGL